ncbi:hypothetical protein [Arenimonas sp.]|uniref:hypothetical protein n=1 Tax=Arenimonas sp. TaxID=1872635 RepID=UPI0035B3930D
MPRAIERTLSGLRSKRDLRAEILDLAAKASETGKAGRLVVIQPLVASSTVQAEWDRLIPVLATGIGQALTLEIVQLPLSQRVDQDRRADERVELQRPNYKHEVLRVLVGASLEGEGEQPLRGLIQKVGVSQTPVRAAVAELKRAGLLSPWTRSPVLEVVPEDMSLALLAKVQALPQTLRLRFAQGARLKSPAQLLDRVMSLLGHNAPASWKDMALSGVPVAREEVPKLDIVGVPRLDLVAHVPRDAEALDIGLFRELDDGLELEPSVLAPAPVVVTLIRGSESFFRGGPGGARWAAQPDVFLSLLDQGLRDQAIEYAKAVRP